MLLPDTVPVYVTTPTAPKLIELPATLPLMCRVSWGDDSAIDPLSAERLCVQVSENVPLNGPLYCPDHVPERSTDGGVWLAVGVGVGMGVAVAVALEVEAGVGVPLVVDALHPANAIAATATTGARDLLLNIALASSCFTACCGPIRNRSR